MMRSAALIPLLSLLLVPASTAAQDLAARRLTAREVPAGAAYRGAFEGGRRWTDRTGDNLLVLSRTDEVPAPGEYGNDGISREIHVYHYLREPAGYRLLWHTVDFVRGCEYDIELRFAPGSLRVTDVDRDGTAETSYVYYSTCTSDVSPSDLKLIMHEGATKYAIRGFTDLRHMGPGYPAPEMRADAALARVPALRAFAERHWRRFVRPAENEGPP